MILDLPARALATLVPGAGWNVPGLRDYRCEDAWISSMRIVRTDKGKDGPMRFRAEGIVMVAESHDRFVTLRLDLLAGEKQLGGGVSSRFDAEETKATQFAFKFEIPAPSAAALVASMDPKLRVRMELQKDRAGYYIPADQTLRDQQAPIEVAPSVAAPTPAGAEANAPLRDLCTLAQRKGMTSIGLSEEQIEAACFLRKPTQ